MSKNLRYVCRSALQWWALVGAILLAAGCQSTTPIAVVELFSHGQCQGLSKGIRQIEFADLAGIRNAQMLTSSQDKAVETTAAPSVLLFAISNGNQPTPGYGFDLTVAKATNTEVELRYRWQTPAPGAVLAQVMTSPCSVIQVEAHPQLTSVSAWLDDTLLGKIDIAE